MKIVLVNQSSGFLVVDDLNAYCRKYNDVAIICGELVPGERELNTKVVKDFICKYDRSSSFKRLATWLWGSIQIFFKLALKYRGYEVVYYTNPPMACFFALLLKNRFRIVEYDIYPDALQTIGIGSSSAIYKVWAALKRKLYKKAECIYTLSDGMKEALAKYGYEEKVRVVPLWSASDKFKPIPKNENVFIKNHGLEGKFIVQYSGNIGYTHSVECMVDIAKQVKDDTDVMFLIIGDGKKKQDIVDEVEKCGLSNVMVLPFQDFSVLPYSLASADLGVITLDENVSKVSVPSKSFNLFAVGAPILAISSEETEMFRILNRYGNGRCIPKSRIDDMVSYIRELKDNKELKQAYSQASIEASKGFTYKNADIFLEDNH